MMEEDTPDVINWDINNKVEKKDFLEYVESFFSLYDDRLENPHKETIWYSTSSLVPWEIPWTLERGREALMEIQKYRLRKSKHRKFTH